MPGATTWVCRSHSSRLHCCSLCTVSGDGVESHPCVLDKMDTQHSQTNAHTGLLQCLGSEIQAKNPLMTLHWKWWVWSFHKKGFVEAKFNIEGNGFCPPWKLWAAPTQMTLVLQAQHPECLNVWLAGQQPSFHTWYCLLLVQLECWILCSIPKLLQLFCTQEWTAGRL